LLIAIHLIALGASFANALPLILKLGTAALIGLNFKLTIPRLNNGQRKIRHTEKHGWEISDDGDFEAIAVAKSTVATSFFIFLHMQDKPALLIARDALSEDDYRQLIVKLKMTVH
jgi:toxin CptA